MSAISELIKDLENALELAKGISDALTLQIPDKRAQHLITIGYSRLYRVGEAIVFSSGLAIDADGAPRAYHPDGKSGLDYLANAGHPGDWWGIATDNGRPSGNPVVQNAQDLAPGFYVSTTALENRAWLETRQDRYVDASVVPFVVLPRGLGFGLQLGDIGICYNTGTGDNQYVIYADIGPRGQIGEGSMALAKDLGVLWSPKTGGISHGIVTVLFPGSGNGYQEMVLWKAKAATIFGNWGGLPFLKSILDQIC